MNVTDFLDYMQEEYSEERLERNENNFLEYFFYYKRNIKSLLTAFKTYNYDSQKRIIIFLLQMYPLSDNFLHEIFQEIKFELHSEITMDTINYLTNAFVEEIGDLELDFDEEIQTTLKQIINIRDLIEVNEDKMSKLLKTKQEFLVLKEKEEKLSREIKALEGGDISALKDVIAEKKKKYQELKNEKNELSKQYDKLNKDLSELERYGELKEKISRCRDILRGLALPKDYLDKLKF